MIGRFLAAWKHMKEMEAQEKRSADEKAIDVLLSDPLQLEKIAQMARAVDRGFSIIRPSDGVELRFYEKGFDPVKREQDGAFF